MLAVFTGSLLINPVLTVAPAPPAADFFNLSWDQMNKATSFKVDCTTIAGPLSRSAGLTTDESHDADMVSQALSKLSIKETDSFLLKTSKVGATREKSPSLLPYAMYKAGKLTYADAVLMTEQTPKFGIQFAINPSALYYREKTTDKWNVIKSKQFAATILDNLSKSKFTDSFDKTSFNFDSWDNGKSKEVTYKGQLTSVSANATVQDMISNAFTVNSALNEVRLHVDAKTKNWDKIEALVTVDAGTISYPLIKTCQFTYGSSVKVAIPASAKNMDLQTGAQAFLDLVNATQQ